MNSRLPSKRSLPRVSLLPQNTLDRVKSCYIHAYVHADRFIYAQCHFSLAVFMLMAYWWMQDSCNALYMLLYMCTIHVLYTCMHMWTHRCIHISLWQAQKSHFDRCEPHNSKHNGNHSCGPEDNEYSSQQLEPKPHSMAVNLESLWVQEKHFLLHVHVYTYIIIHHNVCGCQQQKDYNLFILL